MAARYGASASVLPEQRDATGGDDSKYDSRRFKVQLKWLQRGAIGVVVLLAVVILSGDTLIWRSKRRAARLLREADAEDFARRVRGSVKVDRFGGDHGAGPGARAAGAGGGDGDGDAVDGMDERDGAEGSQQDGARGELQNAWDNDGDGAPADGGAGNRMGWGEADEYGAGGAGAEDEPPRAGNTLAGRDADNGDGGDAIDPPVDWSLGPIDQCANYFGNGYTELFELAPPTADRRSRPDLECRQHPRTTGVMCRGRSMIMHPSRIIMSHGGEDVTAVLGRAEADEVPKFSEGAFELYTNGDLDVQKEPGNDPGAALGTVRSTNLARALERTDKYKLDMLLATRVLDAAQPNQRRSCGQRVREPVVFVTRMEYANLFHTSTDWYNVWSAARVAGYAPTTDYTLTQLTPTSLTGGADTEGAPRMPLHVIFLDGHNASPMDEGWVAMFLSVSYAKHFKSSVCFDDVLFAPFGYQAALSSGLQPMMHACANQPHVRQFSNDMVRGLGLLPRATSMCHVPTTPVLFVRRTHYLAHPRHDGKIVRRLDNEDEIMDALSTHASHADAGISVLNGVFSGMTLRQQVEMAQDACVMVGAHGAGLTHVLFAPPGVHVLELQTPGFQRPHFIAYSFWAGSHSHAWVLPTSTPSPADVIARIQQTAAAAAVDERAARVAEAERGGHRQH
jgi:glycoprotein 2-beta-D-xylosyltransferase